MTNTRTQTLLAVIKTEPAAGRKERWRYLGLESPHYRDTPRVALLVNELARAYHRIDRLEIELGEADQHRAEGEGQCHGCGTYTDEHKARCEVDRLLDRADQTWDVYRGLNL